MSSRNLIIALFFAVADIVNSSNVIGQSIKLFAVSDLKQVFDDGYDLPPTNDTLEIFGIRNEIVSGQCVFYSNEGLEKISVELGPLNNMTSTYTIPKENILWNFVGSVSLTENTPNQFEHVLVRKAPADFPDYLMEDRQLDVEKGIYQPVWLTIEIPADADPGRYSTFLILKSGSKEQSLPLSLTVYPFSMPDERHLKVTEWYSTRNFEKFHGISEKYSNAWFDMLRRYAHNLSKHRQNIFQVPMNSIEITLLADGELVFDFSYFDQIAQIFWDTGKMDYLETGELAQFGEGVWFSTDIHFKDFRVFDSTKDEEITLSGMDVIPYLLPAFENHLRGKGWLEKTLFHVKDEPTLRNVTAWKEASRIIHNYAPDLIRIDALETTHLFDDIEIAVPKLDYLAGWLEKYQEAARQGTELWYYTVGIYQARSYPNKTIDMPLIDNRILHWINYKYDLAGFLHWGWNHWTEDPFKEVGMHIGDAWHVYPSKNGVMNSLRWEQMRNGIQDYEYFWLLEDQILRLRDSLGSRFTWIDPKQRSKEIASQVVKDLLNHSDDPDALYGAKKEIINELLEFNSDPKIYVQTNPPVNATAVKERSYLVEIFGWAEPGAARRTLWSFK
jgi:hypothetical protein